MKLPQILCILCASLIPSALAVQDHAAPAPMTLLEAESVALRNAPAIAAAYFRAEAAKQVVRETRSAFFPQVNVEVSAVGTGDGISNEFGGSSAAAVTRLGAAGGLNEPSVYSRESNGLVISQLISDFGRTANLTAASRFRAQSEAERAETTKSIVLYQVDKAYFKTLESQALLTVSRQTVDERQVVLDQVSALVHGKLKADLDLSIAKVSVGQANLLLVQAQNAVDEAQAGLSTALGCQKPRRFTLVDEPQYPLPKTSVKDLVIQALRCRPELVALRSECAAATRFSAAQHAAQLPKITALGAAGRTPIGDPGTEGNYAAAGINVELPIFNGGRLSAQYQEALLNARADQKRLEEEEEQITEEVNVALLDGQAASKKIAVTQDLTASAHEALELADARFKLGSTSMVDLSQAQLNSTQAEIDYAAAKYEYQMQCVKLEYVTGALKPR